MMPEEATADGWTTISCGIRRPRPAWTLQGCRQRRSSIYDQPDRHRSLPPSILAFEISFQSNAPRLNVHVRFLIVWKRSSSSHPFRYERYHGTKLCVGKFTGFSWTSSGPQHGIRNIAKQNANASSGMPCPRTKNDGLSPEDLWYIEKNLVVGFSPPCWRVHAFFDQSKLMLRQLPHHWHAPSFKPKHIRKSLNRSFNSSRPFWNSLPPQDDPPCCPHETYMNIT